MVSAYRFKFIIVCWLPGVGASTFSIGSFFHDLESPNAKVALLLCAPYSSFEDLAGPLTGVSSHLDNSSVASPTMWGKYGAPT